MIDQIQLRNYRAIRSADIDLRPINVLFGPNGSGKSTLLDALSFLGDAASRSLDFAAADRQQGAGMLSDGARTPGNISLAIKAHELFYSLTLSLSDGVIRRHPREQLQSPSSDIEYFSRASGEPTAIFRNPMFSMPSGIVLREPERLALNRYLDHDPSITAAALLDADLRSIRLYHARSINLRQLKHNGSQTDPDTALSSTGANLWSALRNLHDRRGGDERYRTILGYLNAAFPSLDELLFNQVGPSTVTASFLERGRRKPILTSGAPDGWIELLLLLVSLFGETKLQSQILLFDEPETSLHPWAIAVLSNAVKEASKDWNRQILIATHSPVLLSQFESEELLEVTQVDGASHFRRVSERDDIKDLIERYAIGSLYESPARGDGRRPLPYRSRWPDRTAHTDHLASANRPDGRQR